MTCKKCGIALKDDVVICPACGTAVDGNTAAGTEKSTEPTKKKRPAKKICGIIAIVVIVLGIICAFIPDESDKKDDSITISANNSNGMSFNCDISEWIERFNKSLKEVEKESEIPIKVDINRSSFKQDNTDYDPTEAKIIRYVCSGNYKKQDDWSISLYVDTATEKIVKCDIVFSQYEGQELTYLLLNTVVPSVMSTSDVNFETARTIAGEKTTRSSNGSYFDDNICYNWEIQGNYNIFKIQAMSKEIYKNAVSYAK